MLPPFWESFSWPIKLTLSTQTMSAMHSGAGSLHMLDPEISCWTSSMRKSRWAKRFSLSFCFLDTGWWMPNTLTFEQFTNPKHVPICILSFPSDLILGSVLIVKVHSTHELVWGQQLVVVTTVLFISVSFWGSIKKILDQARVFPYKSIKVGTFLLKNLEVTSVPYGSRNFQSCWKHLVDSNNLTGLSHQWYSS